MALLAFPHHVTSNARKRTPQTPMYHRNKEGNKKRKRRIGALVVPGPGHARDASDGKVGESIER